MLTFYNNNENNGLIPLNSWTNGCWTNVIEPNQQDVEFLTKKLAVPVDFINDIEDIDERPRLEQDEGWTLVIMRIPIKNEYDTSFTTVPLGIIMKDNMVITICFHNNEIISDFILYTQRKVIYIDNNGNFLLRLILSTCVWYQKYLKHINIKTKIIENELEKSIKNRELQSLMKIEKVLVYFLSSLKGNDLLLYKLKNTLYKNSQYDEELMEDVEIESKQAITTTNIHIDILASMTDAYASIISNNVNEIMKKLTSITIIITLPNIISGIFGMNLLNSFETNTYAFITIIISCVVIIAIAMIIFKKMKLF